MTDTYKGGEIVRIDGQVYCEGISSVHDETLNPYGYVDQEDHCTPEQHRPVYFRARKGDWK